MSLYTVRYIEEQGELSETPSQSQGRSTLCEALKDAIKTPLIERQTTMEESSREQCSRSALPLF